MCSSKNNSGVNNNDSFNGEFIMRINSIKTKEDFIGVVKAAIKEIYEDCNVQVNSVVKNNDLKLDGLSILSKDKYITPTIYLENYYESYKAGMSLSDICSEISKIYEDNKEPKIFDTENMLDFNKTKSHICFKLINKERNKELLRDTPHIEYLDLAIIFYVYVLDKMEEKFTFTVKNHILELWGVKDINKLLVLAHMNTQRLFKGEVHTMGDVITDIVSNSDFLDSVIKEEFFHMEINESDLIPMYVATNTEKFYGAGVLLYDGCLKAFAKRIGGDFYIIPSSVHEVLFVPVDCDTDEKNLVEMLRSVNATDVALSEILSDNVYRYYIAMGQVKIIESI